MTVLDTIKDPETLTLTVIAEFDAPRERVWEVFADARVLERWWGPRHFPATFTRHELVAGGESRYHLTGPNGEVHRGFWQTRTVVKPERIEFAQGLAGEDGEPVAGVDPMVGSIMLEAVGHRTRMTLVNRFVDAASMETMLEMGMAEGLTQAIGQIDAVLGAAVA